MRKTMSRSIAVATAAATMLSAVAVQPATAAPRQAQGNEGVTAGGATEFSAQRRHRRGGNADAALALGAVGLVFGTIAGLAAADQRRRHHEHYYGYHHGQPHYAPYAYAPPPAYYGHPGYGYR